MSKSHADVCVGDGLLFIHHHYTSVNVTIMIPKMCTSLLRLLMLPFNTMMLNKAINTKSLAYLLVYLLKCYLNDVLVNDFPTLLEQESLMSFI